MRRILLILLTLCYSLTVKADLPGSAYQYDRYSEDSNYYFKSIPFYNFDLTNFGKTIVYDVKSKKELYIIDHYLPTESFISNTGEILVTSTYWMWGHTDLEKQELMEIYIKGKSAVQYFIADFISDKSKLQKTVSHTLWYEKMFAKNDTLYILTLENKVVRISLATGKIIDKIKLKACKICKTIDQLPRPKTLYYQDIAYPDGYIFPDLVDGRTFRESLIAGLNKFEETEFSSCKYYIMVYGAIDQLGNCEIFILTANVDGNENEAWKNEVSNWVTAQKYKTDLIPQNCDKWVFQDYFYLN